MKVFLVVPVLVALSVAAPPRPSGRLILLPSRQQSPTPRVEGATSTSPPQAKTSEESQPARVLDSGEYYVLTPEGKLQMVKYTTAALQDQSRAAQPAQPAQQPEPFAQFQVQYLQYPGYSPQGAAPSQAKADYKKKPKDAADFEAKVEFRDVQPIATPIYAYNPEPLVRILRK